MQGVLSGNFMKPDIIIYRADLTASLRRLSRSYCASIMFCIIYILYTHIIFRAIGVITYVLYVSYMILVAISNSYPMLYLFVIN